MPYSKVSNHPECPAEKPLGLTLTESGKLLGCHVNEESANAQISAIESGKHTGVIEELIMGENVMHYTRALPDTDNIRAEELLKDNSLPVPFIASTEGLDRYRNYGPILWVHDYTHPPLGTGDAEIDEALRINVTFDTDDPFAMLVRGKAIKGMMGGSVGWATTREKKNELIEFSMVPVGIDPDALPDIQRMGLRAMQSEISEILGEDPNTSLEAYFNDIRQEALDQITAILEEFVEQDGKERELSEEEVEALIEVGEELEEEEEPSATRGEEEEETIETDESDEDELARAGAMLSKKNREDLEAALALIQGVIERATPDEPVPSFSAMRGEDEELEEEEEVEPEEAGETVSQRGQEQELDPSLVDLIVEVIG
jgi:hypothetical protein